MIAEDPKEPFIEHGEIKGPPTMLDMLRSRDQQILCRVGNLKHTIRNTNKPLVKQTLLKERKGTQVMETGVRRQGLPFWLANGAASRGHDNWKPD
eukprot:815027-Heterocapsa_arctica.AAC.1